MDLLPNSDVRRKDREIDRESPLPRTPAQATFTNARLRHLAGTAVLAARRSIDEQMRAARSAVIMAPLAPSRWRPARRASFRTAISY